MKSLTLKEKIIFGIYTAIIFLFYVSFIVLDTAVGDIAISTSTWIKYSSIILSTIFTLHLFIDSLFKKEDILIRLFGLLAVILTLVSDLFLLVINDYYVAGVTVFIFAQLATAARLHLINKNKVILIISMGLRIFAFIERTVLTAVFQNPDMVLYSLVFFYFINLVLNFTLAVITAITDSRLSNIILAIGLFLFIMCDIFVGLANIRNMSVLNFVAWIFYLPCQYLIAISLKMQPKEFNL